MPINDTDEIYDERERRLRPRLTNSFLSVLTDAARTCGHAVDYVELERFVEWCYDVAEQKRPENLEPY